MSYFRIFLKKNFPYLLCFTFALSCGQDKSIQGFNDEDGFDPNDRGQISQKLFTTLEIEETFQDTAIASGLSPSLLLGVFRGVKTSILLKFADIPDTVTITKATIALRTRDIISDDVSKSIFTATVHAVNEDWNQVTVSSDNFQNFDPLPLGSAEILTREDSPDSSLETIRFELNQTGIDLVEQWADTVSGQNFGVLIQPTLGQSFFIKEFFSINEPDNPPQPTLELEVLNGSELDTLAFVAREDSYITETIQEPAPDRLYVDNVLTRQSVIKFDFSEIPRGSSINRAQLILTLDLENSIISKTGFFMQFVNIERPFESPETFTLDEPASVLIGDGIPIITKDTEAVNVSLRGVVQGWVNGDFENHGLLIRTATPGLDVGRIAFPTSKIDSTASIRLDLDFSTIQTIP